MSHSMIKHRPTRQRSRVNLLLHVEGIAVLAAALFVYHTQGFGWLTFGLALLLPDVAMLGYLVNKRIGSTVYNIFHTYTLPLVLGAAGVALGSTLALQAAIIWMAHIGMDRAVGYGLKYATDFKDTHLSRI